MLCSYSIYAITLKIRVKNMWEIEFYEFPTKECPTEEFLRSLHKKDELPYVMREIDLLKEFGNKLHRPHADYLENGIYESEFGCRTNNFVFYIFTFFRRRSSLAMVFAKKQK